MTQHYNSGDGVQSHPSLVFFPLMVIDTVCLQELFRGTPIIAILTIHFKHEKLTKKNDA